MGDNSNQATTSSATIDIDTHNRIVKEYQDEILTLKRQIVMISMTMDRMQRTVKELYDAIDSDRNTIEVLINTVQYRDRKLKTMEKSN